ncbi:MAG: hypothetical protein JXR48_15240 [Candidatus Delongbacteria bacterium]|nr:hypothetical protein [Candidatus Delongbacteria bacterium]
MSDVESMDFDSHSDLPSNFKNCLFLCSSNLPDQIVEAGIMVATELSSFEKVNIRINSLIDSELSTELNISLFLGMHRNRTVNELQSIYDVLFRGIDAGIVFTPNIIIDNRCYNVVHLKYVILRRLQ